MRRFARFARDMAEADRATREFTNANRLQRCARSASPSGTARHVPDSDLATLALLESQSGTGSELRCPRPPRMYIGNQATYHLALYHPFYHSPREPSLLNGCQTASLSSSYCSPLQDPLSGRQAAAATSLPNLPPSEGPSSCALVARQESSQQIAIGRDVASPSPMTR